MATLKQKRAIKILSENPAMPIGTAMVKAGYSKLTSKTPQALTDSEAFQKLFKKAITDDELIKAHKAGLKAYISRPQIVDRDEKNNPIYKYNQEPDFNARHKYLDTAYKLRGFYKDENETTKPVTINVTLYERDGDRHSLQVRTTELPTSIPPST